MTLVSQAEYARRIGLTRAAISQFKTQGRLVMNGSQVDVEASDAKLRRYRRAGLPDVNPNPKSVKRGRPSVKQDAEADAQLNSEPVCLTCEEIETRLQQMDWKQTFDWSDAAQHQRAVEAARCIGWEVVWSDLRDSSHWGGYQLRISGHDWSEVESGGVSVDAVAAGHGYELSVLEVLQACRAEIVPIEDDDDDDGQSTIVPALLPLLARPFGEWDKPR